MRAQFANEADFKANLRSSVSPAVLSQPVAPNVDVLSALAKAVGALFAKILSAFSFGPKLKARRKVGPRRNQRRAAARARLKQMRHAKQLRASALRIARKQAAIRPQQNQVVSGPSLLDFRALEPRIVFDGAAVDTADQALESTDPTPQLPESEAVAADQREAQSDALAEAIEAISFGAPENTQSDSGNAIIFVDSEVEIAEQLIAEAGVSGEVVYLSADRDGVEQIAEHMSGLRNIDALHIVSHGAAGELRLGDSVLNAASIAGEHADEMAVIAAALSENADILVYGCEFAQDASAVEVLSLATGADVAASDDVTGHADLGGDWDLEVEQGVIEAEALSAADWHDTLAPTNTGTWAVSGNTATTTTAGITTTVTFTPNTANASFSSVANGTFNTIPAFSNGADGDPSLSFVYLWDTTPEAATGLPLPQAATDSGLGTITIAFSKAVTNPIINLDRLGGNGGFQQTDGFGNVITEEMRSNGALWTITTAGATLTKVSGVSHFEVTANTIQRTPNELMPYTGTSPESGTNSSTNTAAGSVQVNGTFTSLTFELTGVGVEGGGADGIEMGFILEPNTPPVGVNDTIPAIEDTPVTQNVLGNDTDVDNDPLTISAAEFDTDGNGTPDPLTIGTPTPITDNGGNPIGTVTVAANGDVTFDPAPNYTGPVPDLTYTPNDGTVDGSPATVSFGPITPVNDAPVAVDDTGATDEDTVLAVPANAILGNDTDPESDPLTVAAVNGDPNHVGNQVTLPSGALLTVNADGSYEYDPNGAFEHLAVGDSTTDTFTYDVTDGNGGFDTATVTIDIAGVNDAPVANNDVITINEDTTLTTNVITAYGIDTDADADTLTIVDFTIGGTTYPYGTTVNLAEGQFALSQHGTLTFVPAADFSGAAPQATYTLSDGTATDTATIDITVTPVNDAPVAVDDTGATDEDTVLAVPANAILGNDADPESDPLTVAAVNGDPNHVGNQITLPSGALLTVNADGSYEYDPNGAFEHLAVGDSTTDTFTYDVTDGNGGFDTATVTIDIAGVNDAPVAVDDTAAAAEDNQASGDLTPGTPGQDSDVDGDTLTVTQFVVGGSTVAVDPVAGGSITLTEGVLTINADGTFTFDPATNFNGAVPTVIYTISDGNGGTDTAELDITVTPVNDAPVAQDDALAGDEDTVVNANLFADNGSGVDNDPDGDAITVTRVVSSASEAGLATVADGTGVGIAVDGTNGGTFTVAANGTVTFDPGDDFNGLGTGETATTQFVYQIDDGNGGTDQAVVTYTVTGINDAPIPVDPTQPPIDPNNPPPGVPFDPDTPFVPPVDPTDYIPHQTGEDSTPVTSLDLTPYIGDPDAPDAVTLSIDPAELPAGLTFDPLTGVISGTPAADASQGGDDPLNNPGVYIIPVTATDPHGATFKTNVTYTITNPPPVAQDDALTGDEDTVVNANLFADNGSGVDNDPDGDAITVTRVVSSASEAGLATVADGAGVGIAVDGTNGGTFTVAANGTVTFDPGDDFNGLGTGETATTAITYQIDDGQGGMDTATATYTVIGVNDAPVPGGPDLDNDGNPDGGDVDITTPEDRPIRGQVIATDVDSPTRVYSGPTTGPTHGTVVVNPDGTYVYTPERDYHGPDQFVVSVNDGQGGTLNITVDVTVTPVQDAMDDFGTMDQDTQLTVDVLANDTFSGLLRLTSATSLNGDAMVNPDGTVTFTPTPGFVGEAVITYVVTDAHGHTETATVRIDVLPVSSQLPAAAADSPVPELPGEPQRIVVEPIVLETANGVSSLSGTPDLATDGIIVSAVNGAGSLNGVEDSRIEEPRNVWDRLPLWNRSRAASDGLGEPEGLTGFSVRYQPNGDLAGQNNVEFVVESLVRDGALQIRISNVDTGGDAQAVSYRVTQADGSPLPRWLEAGGPGRLIGKRPVSSEHIALRIEIEYSDGTKKVRNVEVQTVTGEIQPLN